MPSYEMALIYRVMERPQMSSAIKRMLETVMGKGGIVSSMENLGTKRLPYRMNRHRQGHNVGHYFLVNFESRPTLPAEMMEYLYRDRDIIRPRVLRREVEQGRPCDYQPCYYGELDDGTLQQLQEQKERHIKKL